MTRNERHELRCTRCRAVVAFANSDASIIVECPACASEHDLLRELLRAPSEIDVPHFLSNDAAHVLYDNAAACRVRRSDLRIHFRLLNDAERVNNGGKNDSS